MRVLKVADRSAPVPRLDGSMEEVTLLRLPRKTAATPPMVGEEWELVLARADAGAAVLPIPFATEEVGYVLQGEVELTELPADYSFEEGTTDQGSDFRLGVGDAFHIARGNRVMIDVVDDLVFLLWRRVERTEGTEPPPGLCV